MEVDSTIPLSKEPYVTIRLHLSRGALPRAVLLAVIVALVPLPVTAAENGKPPAKPSSLREAAATIPPRDLAVVKTSDSPQRSSQTMTRPAFRRSEQASNPTTQSSSFFTTPTGIVVLSALAAGVGYALYSAQHDRIHSPGKN